MQAKTLNNKNRRYSESSYAVYGSEVDPIYKKPLDCGVLPGEIVLLDWLDGKDTKRFLPDYFTLLYGLDVETSINTLMIKKFAEIAPPFKSLNSLKVVEIKDILEANNLPKSGKKADLIELITTSLTEKDVARYIKNDSYCLTDKGRSLLDEYYYIPYAHKNRMEVLSVAEMLKYTEEEREKLIGVGIGTEILLKRLKLAIENKDFFIARSSFLSLAKINNSNKDTESCVIAYLCMFICDVSGWGNNGDYHENNIFDEHCATTAARLIGKKLDMGDLRNFFDRAWGQIGKALPKHYLGKEKAYECLVAGFNKDTETIRRLLNLDNRKERDYRF